jgi:hypothetical protein
MHLSPAALDAAIRLLETGAHFSPPRVRIAGSALVSLGAKGTWLASRFHRAVDRSSPSINHACCAAPWIVRAGSSALGQ